MEQWGWGYNPKDSNLGKMLHCLPRSNLKKMILAFNKQMILFFSIFCPTAVGSYECNILSTTSTFYSQKLFL